MDIDWKTATWHNSHYFDISRLVLFPDHCDKYFTFSFMHDIKDCLTQLMTVVASVYLEVVIMTVLDNVFKVEAMPIRLYVYSNAEIMMYVWYFTPFTSPRIIFLSIKFYTMRLISRFNVIRVGIYERFYDSNLNGIDISCCCDLYGH